MKSAATTVIAGLVAALSPVASAAPDASTGNFAITTGCSQFPGYTAGSNVTEPFVLQFVQSKAPINGNGLVTFNYYDSNKGRYAIPVSNDLAKTPARCNQANSSANGGAPAIEVLGDGWQPLQIFAPAKGADPNAGNAQLVYGAAVAASQPVVAYTHDAAGKGGIFLGGADKSSQFASSLEFTADDVHRSFWHLRYVPRGGAVIKAEYAGFVQVNGS